MLKDSRYIADAYSFVTEGVPGVSVATTQSPVLGTPIGGGAQNEQQVVEQPKKDVKDWIRLPFIRTPFQARMAAILIVELLNNMCSTDALKDLVLKEIRTSNRLHRKK